MNTIEALDIAIRNLKGSVQSHYDWTGQDDEHLAMEILVLLRTALAQGAEVLFMGDVAFVDGHINGGIDEFEMDYDEIGDDHHVAGHPL